jgi:hypothetical protein
MGCSFTYYGDGSLAVLNAQGVVVASYTYQPGGLLGTAAYSGKSLTNTGDGVGNRIGLSMLTYRLIDRGASCPTAQSCDRSAVSLREKSIEHK